MEPTTNSDFSLEPFDPYKSYIDVNNAIKIREEKRQHSEFYYKLNEIVDQIKEYK